MEKDFWKLHEDIVFQRANGKIIWQPRMDCWIDDKIFEKGELPGRYKGMKKSDIYRDLGCSARIYEYNGCFYRKWDKRVNNYQKDLGNRQIANVIETPVGTVSQIVERTESTWAGKIAKEWVTSEEDLKVWMWIEATSEWGWNQEHFERTKAEWGRLGAPCIFMPRISMQNLYIDLMGVEQTVYALYDYPDTIDEYFKALRASHLRLIEIINQSPINIINFGDNIHSGTLSPAYFEKYVLEEYQIRCNKLHEAGKFVYSHFDGDNRGLTKYYQQTGLDGVEAITPVPQGDITLEEAKEGLGDLFMIDGLPAVYFDETYDVEILKETTHKIIELFAPNLILGISDEISSTGDIERIRIVGEIVDQYNAKIEKEEKLK